MLNSDTIFFKTEAGVAEVKARSLGLRTELRRLLILVDGHAPLSRLSVFVRGSEIDFLIAELELLGLVTNGRDRVPAAGDVASLPIGPTYVNPEPTRAQILAVTQAAILSLQAQLGPDAAAHIAKIEQSTDSKALRVVITEIRQALDRQLGANAGQQFLDAVRAAADQTR
jgi:hypothetical protein